MLVFVAADDRVPHWVVLGVLGFDCDDRGELRRALHDRRLVQELVEDRASKVRPSGDTDLFKSAI